MKHLRQDYLDKKCSHSEYYGQFVTRSIIVMVVIRFGLDELKAAFAADKNLNSIPLALWDALGGYPHRRLCGQILMAAGDSPTMSTAVCILKEAARQAIEERKVV
jgi:hypothetical protein